MARRRNAWLTPDDTASIVWSGRCLNVPEPLYPSVVGALSLLTESWRWEQFGTMTPDDAAQLATVMLEEFANEGCSGMDCLDVIQCLVDAGLLDTNLPDGEFQIVDGVPQVSFDEGVTWQDVISGGSAEPYVPTPIPTEGATDEIRICLAATRAALVLNETYKGVYGAVTAGIYNASNTFANWLLVLNGQLLGLIYGEQYQILNSEILRDYSLPTNYTAGELTSGQIDDLICFLLGYATDNPDGIVTFDWGAIRDNMVAVMGANPGTALWSIVVYLQNRGLGRASQVTITDTGDCAHCGEFCVEFDFTFSDGGFVIPAISETACQPAWSSLGWRSGQLFCNANATILWVWRTLDEPVLITDLSADIADVGGFSSSSYVIALDLNGTQVWSQNAPGDGTVYHPNVTANRIRFQKSAGPNLGTGSLKLMSMTIAGEGEAPSGGQDC